MTDVCPGCGGVADNGHDRCDPPNVYLCKRCEARVTALGKALPPSVFDAAEKKSPPSFKARRAELVKEFMLRLIGSERHFPYPHESTVLAAEWADAFLAWEAEQ